MSLTVAKLGFRLIGVLRPIKVFPRIVLRGVCVCVCYSCILKFLPIILFILPIILFILPIIPSLNTIHHAPMHAWP